MLELANCTVFKAPVLYKADELLSAGMVHIVGTPEFDLDLVAEGLLLVVVVS